MAALDGLMPLFHVVVVFAIFFCNIMSLRLFQINIPFQKINQDNNTNSRYG